MPLSRWTCTGWKNAPTSRPATKACGLTVTVPSSRSDVVLANNAVCVTQLSVTPAGPTYVGMKSTPRAASLHTYSWPGSGVQTWMRNGPAVWRSRNVPSSAVRSWRVFGASSGPASGTSPGLSAFTSAPSIGVP